MIQKDHLLRRDVLKRVAALTGLAISAPIMMGFLSGCGENGEKSIVLLSLSKNHEAMIASISDLIIPDTDTGGAIAAGVPEYINLMINQWFDEGERQSFLRGIERVDEWSKKSFGTKFITSSAKQQVKTLEYFDAETSKYQGEKTFFQTFKQLTLIGYFSSEIGAEETLRYEAVPGPYEGCIDFSEIGRTWAT